MRCWTLAGRVAQARWLDRRLLREIRANEEVVAVAVLAGLRDADVEVADELAVVDLEGRIEMMVDMSIVTTGMPWTTIHC